MQRLLIALLVLALGATAGAPPALARHHARASDAYDGGDLEGRWIRQKYGDVEAWRSESYHEIFGDAPVHRSRRRRSGSAGKAAPSAPPNTAAAAAAASPAARAVPTPSPSSVPSPHP